MGSTLTLVVLFVAALALLPWLVRRLQQHRATQSGTQGTSSRIVSDLAIGPQQRVVTVEVGPEGQRTRLVLGVTAQNIHCLHVLPDAHHAPQGQAPLAAGAGATGFAREMAAAVDAAPTKAPHA